MSEDQTTRIATVAEIQALQHKGIIFHTELSAISVYERKSGTNQRGEWSIQNVKCVDAQGAEIKVAFHGHDEVPFKAGQWFTLSAYHGQNGWSGLYAEDDTYQGTTTRIIKATKTAQIGIGPSTGTTPPDPQTQGMGGAGQANAQQPATQPEQAPQQPQQQPSVPTPATPKAPENGSSELTDARRMIVQFANLHTLCALAVMKMESPTLEGVTGTPMSESQLQGAIASIYISSERAGMARKMPTKPFTAEDLKK